MSHWCFILLPVLGKALRGWYTYTGFQGGRVSNVFLTARWHYLAMLNYEVPAELLAPMVPKGTELDTFDGVCIASIVGFMFLDTRLKGVPVPFHRDFEELNLRFYVRREVDDEVRRGVVFVKEIVPKPALAFVARVAYNENYVHMPMRHHLDVPSGEPRGEVSYGWKSKSGWNEVAVTPEGASFLPEAGSEAEFITEHYWGYAVQRDGGTVEYRVAHPQWDLWQTVDSRFQCDVAEIYGEAFVPYLQGKPRSALLARGSEIEVYDGTHIV